MQVGRRVKLVGETHMTKVVERGSERVLNEGFIKVGRRSET